MENQSSQAEGKGFDSSLGELGDMLGALGLKMPPELDKAMNSLKDGRVMLDPFLTFQKTNNLFCEVKKSSIHSMEEMGDYRQIYVPNGIFTVKESMLEIKRMING